MRRLRLDILILLMLSLCLSACRKEDPNPELKDPIFKDLKARADAHAKGAEEGKAKMLTLREAAEKAEANTIELKDIRRDIAKTQLMLLDDEQKARYYKIRAERRRVMGRKAYREAFARKEEWPSPTEYSEYLVNIRLNEVNLNWNARVPRLQDRLPANQPKAAKK